jgi:hypothetical protein
MELSTAWDATRFITTFTRAVLILNQTNPVYTTPSYLCKIHLNMIHPPTSWAFLVVSFPLALPPITYMCSFSSPFVLHVLPISSSSTWSFKLCLAKSTNHDVPCYAVFSALPSHHPALSQIQVSHLYRTTGRIIVLYVLIFKFSDSRREW